MFNLPWLQVEFFHLKIRTWLILFFFFLVGALIAGLFFIRRQVVEYRPEHTFNVSSAEFFGSAHALGEPFPIHGNKITLLHNGDQIFPAILEAVKGAKKSINFEAYIFNSDATGRQFLDALMERARAGVKVRVMVDGMGSSTALDNDYVEKLQEAGCEFSYYHPVRSLRFDKLNRRSHRRVIVMDGKLGFTGGMGFSDDWAGNADAPNHWRDIGVRLEGPLVATLQGAFQQHWMKETEKMLAGADEFPALPATGPLKAQVTASHSYSLASVPVTQAVAIAAAEKRIWIANPYCTPTDDQITLLVAAVKRGVDVKMLVPGKHNDQPATKAAGRTSYGELLRGGVQIYEFSPTMIHQKTMVVDSLFSLLGSSNLDARSAQLNEELDISVYDANFGKEMETVFEKDLQQAKRYTLEEYQQRGLWERFSEWVMIPFHSQL